MVAGVSTGTLVTSIAIPQAATATVVVPIEAHDVRRRRLNWKEDLVSKILCLKSVTMGFPGGTSGKEPTFQCLKHKRGGLDPWVGKIS